jgi:hypothetical protein
MDRKYYDSSSVNSSIFILYKADGMKFVLHNIKRASWLKTRKIRQLLLTLFSFYYSSSFDIFSRIMLRLYHTGDKIFSIYRNLIKYVFVFLTQIPVVFARHGPPAFEYLMSYFRTVFQYPLLNYLRSGLLYQNSSQ